MTTSIQENLKETLASLPANVKLVAVSKFHPAAAVQSAYDAGQRIFGESKVQELTAKAESLPKDIEWHFIGHLQTNKVKQIVPFISMIQSVDSLRLLEEINKWAERSERVIDILLQVHIAAEDTKFGFSPKECIGLLQQYPPATWKHVRIRGLMGMATFTDDTEQIKTEFGELTSLFERLKSMFFSDVDYFNEMSFGMSDDYPIAVQEGSTMVRIGSRIFGERNY